MQNVQLLLIDPQNDFCDPNGSLYVPGAERDCQRIGSLIERMGRKLSGIGVTLDSHHLVDIAHPVFWVDSKGSPPPPFSVITEADLDAGRWRTRHPGAQQRAREYVRALAQGGRYELRIWPPHCLIGTAGSNLHPKVLAPVLAWEEKYFRTAIKLTKGSNPWTEHYGAVQAEVPDPTDPSTGLNTNFIAAHQGADLILLAGEARGFCLASTVRQFAAHFGEVDKFVLLTDCTSDVPGTEGLGESFVSELVARGMRLAQSTDF